MEVLRNQARRLLAVPFVLDGVAALRDPAPRVKEFTPAVHRLSRIYPWLPNDPELLVRLQGSAALTGGALLLLGWAPRTASVLLAAQSAPVLLTGLRGARDSAPEERVRHRSSAIKDLSLFGALVLAATEPKKRPSRLRWEAEHAVGQVRKSTARAQRKAARKAKSAAARRR